MSIRLTGRYRHREDVVLLWGCAPIVTGTRARALDRQQLTGCHWLLYIRIRGCIEHTVPEKRKSALIPVRLRPCHVNCRLCTAVHSLITVRKILFLFHVGHRRLIGQRSLDRNTVQLPRARREMTPQRQHRFYGLGLCLPDPYFVIKSYLAKPNAPHQPIHPTCNGQTHQTHLYPRRADQA